MRCNLHYLVLQIYLFFILCVHYTLHQSLYCTYTTMHIYVITIIIYTIYYNLQIYQSLVSSLNSIHKKEQLHNHNMKIINSFMHKQTTIQSLTTEPIPTLVSWPITTPSALPHLQSSTFPTKSKGDHCPVLPWLNPKGNGNRRQNAKLVTCNSNSLYCHGNLMTFNHRTGQLQFPYHQTIDHQRNEVKTPFYVLQIASIARLNGMLFVIIQVGIEIGVTHSPHHFVHC